MYAQHNRGHGGCSYGSSRDCDGGNNKEIGQINQQNWSGQ